MSVSTNRLYVFRGSLPTFISICGMIQLAQLDGQQVDASGYTGSDCATAEAISAVSRCTTHHVRYWCELVIGDSKIYVPEF